MTNELEAPIAQDEPEIRDEYNPPAKPTLPGIGEFVTFTSVFPHELGNEGIQAAPAIVTGWGADGSLGLTIFRYGADPLAILGVFGDGETREQAEGFDAPAPLQRSWRKSGEKDPWQGDKAEAVNLADAPPTAPAAAPIFAPEAPANV